MDKSIVGICCTEKAFQAFRNAWNSTGIRPDQVLKDEDLYYIVWENILWHVTLNNKIQPLLDLMKCLDGADTKLMDIQALKRAMPYLECWLPPEKRGDGTILPDYEYLEEFLEEHLEEFLYTYIELREDGYIQCRGSNDLGFEYDWELSIPSSAVMCDPDDPEVTHEKTDIVAYALMQNHTLTEVFSKKEDAVIIKDDLLIKEREQGQQESCYEIRPIRLEWIKKKLKEEGKL